MGRKRQIMQRWTTPARWLSTSILFAASAITLAQDAPAPQQAPPTTRPTTRPTTGPAVRVASTQPTTIPSKISLNFKDTPLDNVLDFLSRTLGFEVLKDGPIDARVNITSKQPVTPEEAITLVNAALKANGFVVVREGKMLHVSPRDKAKKANVPVHFGSEPADIPETDELITQVIPIKNVNAGKLKEDLKPMLPDADLISNEGSNTIIITDTSATVHRLVLIIRKLDDHEAETSEIKIIPLKHANATAVAKIIDTFFKSSGGGGGPQQPQPGMPMVMGPNGQPMPQKGGGGGGAERHGATVITAADDRTNTLLVMASGETLKSIESIVARLDNEDPNPAPGAIMRAFPLKYAIAEDTAKLINTVFKNQQDNNYSPYILRIFGGGGDEQKKDWKINAAFDERTNTVIVTGSKEAVAAVEDLIKILDANQVAPSELKVFHLKHADAFIVAGQIGDMFKPKEEQNNRFPFLIFSDMPAPPARLTRLHVTSDDRTNTVIVTAPAEMMKPIGDVIQELDADPSTEDTLFIYHLRNAQAENLEFVLNVLFGNIQNGQNPNQQGPNNGQNPNQQNNQNRFGPDQGNNQNNQNNQNNRNNRNNNRRNNRNGQQGMPNMNQNIAHAVNELTGKVFVVADLDTNSLMVTTASKYERQVRMIIEDLDRPVPQVLIKVLVAEVTHDNSADLGLDFSVLNQRSVDKNGVITRGQTANQSFGAPGSGLIVSMLESQLNATLHALAQENKLDVLSRPYILASDNQLANIFIGSNVPFVTYTQITEAGQLINTVQNRDIGLNLSVTPHINPDGMVILDVSEEIQQLTAQQVPISNTTFSPVIAKRSADSRIGVLNNQTIVIGGLMEDRKTDTINKIPILGDIPGLGMLFRRTQTTKTKTELLIFLTPHVAQMPDFLETMSNDEMKGTKLTPNAVTPGTFQEQMKGMRRGQSPQTQPSGPVSPVNSIDLSEPSGKPRANDPTTQPAH